MKEAKITINHRELSEGQSMAVRVAVVAFLSELNNPKVSAALGQVAIGYHQRLSEVMTMIDDTQAEPEKLMALEFIHKHNEDDILRALEFIHELITKRKEEQK